MKNIFKSQKTQVSLYRSMLQTLIEQQARNKDFVSPNPSEVSTSLCCCSSKSPQNSRNQKSLRAKLHERVREIIFQASLNTIFLLKMCDMSQGKDTIQ